jgi:hypothetical protein
VRIITFAVMAALLFVSALVFTLSLHDVDIEVAHRDTVSYWGSETAPMGSVMLTGDGGYLFDDYIPLLGYVWWFGFPANALLLVAGLAIVYVSRRPRVPGSFITPRIMAVGVAIALFGWAVAPSFTCEVYECHRWPAITFEALLLGFLLLAFAAFFPRRLSDRLRERRGSASG